MFDQETRHGCRRSRPRTDAGPAAARLGPRRRAALRRRRRARAAAPTRRQGLCLLQRRRRPRHRSGHARAHPCIGDPTGLSRRLDLRRSARPPAGHRPRRPRPQAVPLPSALAPGARPGQVRPRRGVRRTPAGIAASARARPETARVAARKGAGDRGQPVGRDADPGRQPPVRTRQQQFRPDHAAQPPRALPARQRDLQLPRQERQGAPGQARRRPAGPADPQLPAVARPATVPVPGRIRRTASGRLRRRQ